MKAFIEELKVGDPVDSLFSVKYKRAVSEYGGGKGYYFSFGAADRTGEIEVTYWGGPRREAVQGVHDSFREGEVVRVQGMTGTYKERKKIDVNEGKGAISATENYDLKDFLPQSEKDVEELYKQLLGLVGSLKHDGLRALLNGFFADSGFAEEFKRAPAAMYMHHAWLGGLLEHSLSVARSARFAAQAYEGADLDLVTAGALLHDVGKLKEFEVTTSIKVGEEGMLRGHTVIGEEMVRKKAAETGLDARTLLKLCHIILSHHGKLEHGAPKEPAFVEAVIVHYADMMDARANQFARIKRETTSEDFRVYDKHWGEVYLR